MKIIKIVALSVVLSLTVCQISSSQTTIKSISAFKQNSRYNFSQEWQYLSTDLYLVNTEKFSNLINEVAHKSSGRKKRRKFNQEQIQSLFLKATIKNLKFFGGDVVYPIFNFKISEDENFKIYETESTEVVRLIDNLPLNESNEVIDADISGEAITQKNSNEFLKLIATQLQGLSQVTKPNTAILDLIGEFGKYIESKTKGKQYKFNSTIRLYEGQDFNKKLHSVNIYVLAPSNISTPNVLSGNLKNYLDTCANPQIDQARIKKMVLYKKYPMVVIANYKSRYNSKLAVGDQINFDYLIERRRKIQNAYDNELINKSTYNQELKLIEFLKFFAELKLNINNYKLNLKNNITDDYSRQHFLILKIYRDLLKTKKLRMVEFAENSEFNNEFLPKYESVINNAGLYLNEKNSLTNIKEVAELLDNSKQEKKEWDATLVENNLRLLHSIKIPTNEINSETSILLKQLTTKLELLLFEKEYRKIIEKINSLSTDNDGLKEKEKIESEAGNTYCVRCKSKLSTALEKYNERFNANERNKAIAINEELKQNSISILFDALSKKKCIETTLVNNNDSTGSFNDLIEIELQKLTSIIEETRNNLKLDISSFSTAQFIDQNDKLKINNQKLKDGFLNLCKYLSNNCECIKPE